MPVTRSQSQRPHRFNPMPPYGQSEGYQSALRETASRMNMSPALELVKHFIEAFGRPSSDEDLAPGVPTGARDVLMSLREDIRDEAVNAIAHAMSETPVQFQKLRETAPRSVCQIEVIRQQVIGDLSKHDQFVAGGSVDLLVESINCATKIRKHVQHMKTIMGNYRSRNDAKLAAGVMLMILEDLMERGSGEGDRRLLYDRLIACVQPEDQEIAIEQHMREFPEDIIKAYLQSIWKIIDIARALHNDPRAGRLAESFDQMIEPFDLRKRS